MFEGDLESGELEIGQISARLDRIETASEIVSQMIEEYRTIAGDNPFFGF
jgi:enoyl-[acyl-carrier protein] reductase II